VIYELRKWYGDLECLYTDDRRVKDLALREPNLQIIASYFRTPAELQPFAWDIVGPRDSIAPIAGQFKQRARASSVRRGT
jgi:hypothetical protein